MYTTRVLENVHEDGIWGCAWSPNGQIVTGSCDELVQVLLLVQTLSKKG